MGDMERQSRYTALLTAAAALVLAAVPSPVTTKAHGYRGSPWTSPLGGNPPATAPATAPSTKPATQPTEPREMLTIAGEEFHLEIAATPEARERGLMERDHLDPDHGMLFIYPEPKVLSFWMKNCLIDIDVVFLDARGRIVRTHAMKAEPLRRHGEPEAEYETRLHNYSSGRIAQFGIELPAGDIKRLKLEPGQWIEMDLPRLKALAK